MSGSATVGYARVSTADQHTSRQLVGVKLDRLFEEKASGKNISDRPVLREMIAYVREGDVLYVHSMDRLARNLDDLLRLVKEITGKGVTIHFVKENLKFEAQKEGSAMSKLLLSVMGAVAEFERSLILERQREGIALAKARGAYKGRKPLDETKQRLVRELIAEGKSKTEVAQKLGISRSTLYKYLPSSERGTHHG